MIIYRKNFGIRFKHKLWEVVESPLRSIHQNDSSQWIDSQTTFSIYASPSRADAVKVLRERKRRIKKQKASKSNIKEKE